MKILYKNDEKEMKAWVRFEPAHTGWKKNVFSAGRVSILRIHADNK